MAYASIPDSITVREGRTATVNLSLLNLTYDQIVYTYYSTTSDGTASSNDLRSVNGGSSLFVVSSGYSEQVPIQTGAAADDRTENTETAYLIVSLHGTVPFADGSMYKRVKINIVDDNMVAGTDSSDTLRGTSKAEKLQGFDGNDS